MFSNLISTEELASHYDPETWRICDCRFTLTDPELGRQAYQESHIPESIYIDLEKDLSGPKEADRGRHPLPLLDEFAEKIGAWGIDENTQVVVYDDSFGSIAARMWWLLRWVGHMRVAVLDGGWQKWKRESRSIDNHVAIPKAKPKYRLSCQDSYIAEAEELLDLSDLVLVDARAEERFTGNIEPFDKVAGHVPGANNLPYEDNLDIDGTFLKGEELLEVYQPLMGGREYRQMVLMCGSGVTACHSLVALDAAGAGMVRLYPGSWSEWITNPNRPVATGENE